MKSHKKKCLVKDRSGTTAGHRLTPIIIKSASRAATQQMGEDRSLQSARVCAFHPDRIATPLLKKPVYMRYVRRGRQILRNALLGKLGG